MASEPLKSAEEGRHEGRSWQARRMAFAEWARRVSLARKLRILLVLAALASTVATYAAWTGWAPFGTRDRSVLLFLLLDALLFVIVATVVVVHVVRIWMERRRGASGSRLHTRLVLLFSLVAITPTFIVAISSVVVFNLGIEAWFNNVVRTALNESDAIARAYLDEHRSTLRGDVLAMSNDFGRAARAISESPERMQSVLASQASLRALDEASIRDSRGTVFARWSSTGFGLFSDPVPEQYLEQARGGALVVYRARTGDSIRAVIKLEPFIDAYLEVSRKVAPDVLTRIDRTRQARLRYQEAEGRRTQVEITLLTMFVFVALLVLLAAVWVGLVFASRLAQPISQLVNAAEGVRAGDLAVRVEEEAGPDELGTLSRAFNRMTEQLGSQRDGLIEANRQLDHRRHFIETVLAGVSSCVVGLDHEGRINVFNDMANALLFESKDDVIGKYIHEIIPECDDLLTRAQSGRAHQEYGEIVRKADGESRTFLVRISRQKSDDPEEGFVVTFDDITALQAAQRKAAWSDVARRIAHEIKNPLTPIQLAAERLRRKYQPQIVEDSEAFVSCTETIVRHVGDIGRLVDEFSSFARMPAPSMKTEDLAAICREAWALFENAHRDISFDLKLDIDPCMIDCDRGQIGQALTNLVQNAVESVQARSDADKNAEQTVSIELKKNEGDRLVVEILDSGIGLPDTDRERLTEPYVTTREKGTGLGLAIVKKIMEDHGGELRLEAAATGGALVTLEFAEGALKNVLESSAEQTGMVGHGG